MNLKGLRRDARSVLVGTSSTTLAGPNLNRFALIIGCPAPTLGAIISDGAIVGAASTAAGGVKLLYTVPAGAQGYLTSASVFATTGAGAVSALQLIRGGTTIVITNATTAGSWQGRVALQAGDVVQWNTTTAVGGSVADFMISVERDIVEARVTIALAPPAVLDAGINLYAGQAPLVLCYDQLGTALHEDVAAIATPAAITIGVVDVFWP